MTSIWGKGGMRAWRWSYYGKKAAILRANGNAAAAEALILEHEIPADRIPTLDAKGKRRGKTPRVRATEETPPPKMEPINKSTVRRADR